MAPEVICPANQTVTSNGPFALPDYFATGETVALDNFTNSVTVTDQDPNVGTLLEEGTYSITLSAEDGNGFESNCSFELTVIDLLGAESPEISLASIALFPNPAINSLTISNPKLLEIEDITIYDLNGRVVIQKTIGIVDRATINVFLLQSATYMVVINSKQGNVIKRLLIE
jgi:hypothetical protein